ncbi:MAG: hypothetical protein IPM64_02840 [Phycisphaerales bacterium]|nr:hypothetical protein [Phycisphaerales bacterium]
MSSDGRSAGTRVNPLIRLFSSITFGVILLGLIFAYSSVVSAVAPLRYAIEMTEMHVFQHWIFALLVALFCTTLSVATLRCIRWNVTNLGVLTVHSGLLILIGGSTAYFWGKIEGDVLLLAPSLQLVRVDDPHNPLLELHAEVGQSWQTSSPAIGGTLRFEVIATSGEPLRKVRAATVRIRLGEQERDVTLTAAQPATPIGGILALQLRPSEAASHFVDRDAAALYWRTLDEPDSRLRSAQLPQLPMYLERFLPGKHPIRDTIGREVASHRTEPAVPLLGFSIPTGMLETWRMPVEVATGSPEWPFDRPDAGAPELPFDVTITGYLPVVRGFAPRASANPSAQEPFPGVNIRFATETGHRDFSLFAADPALSVTESDSPLEFVWVRNEAEREAAVRSRAGPHELTVRVANPPVEQTLAVVEGQTVQVEGTPYELTIRGFEPRWLPMGAAGGAAGSTTGPAAFVQINSGIRRFTRAVPARPGVPAQDSDDRGAWQPQGMIDANITLEYRSSPAGLLRIVAGPGEGAAAAPELVAFMPSGRAQRNPLTVGGTSAVLLAGERLDVTIEGLFERAMVERVPVVEAPERRRVGGERALSAVRLELAGRGEHSQWRRTQWCMFSDYPQDAVRPLRVDGPDGRSWVVVYSRRAHPLGGALSLDKLSVRFRPGRTSVDWWRSDYLAQTEGGDPVAAHVHTNQTHVFNGWTLFQASAPGNEPHFRFTVLGVGNRRGIWPMTVGCVLITLGSLYAFYVKPLLLRRRRDLALAEAQRSIEAPPPRALQEVR